MNHTAKSYPLELGMPPGVVGCLQMLMAHPSDYIIDELWTRLHKLYVSCDYDGTRVRPRLRGGRLAPDIRTGAGHAARDANLGDGAGGVWGLRASARRVLRPAEGGAQVGTRCWETGGFTAMHVRQAQLFKRLHCCDHALSDDIIDDFSYMPPLNLKKVPTEATIAVPVDHPQRLPAQHQGHPL